MTQSERIAELETEMGELRDRLDAVLDALVEAFHAAGRAAPVVMRYERPRHLRLAGQKPPGR